MRENLLLHGIPELASNDKEDASKTLEIVKTFFVEDLKMDQAQADNIKISTAHRLGRRRTFTEVVREGSKTKQPPGPRPIVVRFVIRNTRDKIKKDGNKTLRTSDKKTRISDQYPRLIVERRKILYPIQAEAFKKGRNVRLVADKLYINDTLYTDHLPWSDELLGIEKKK